MFKFNETKVTPTDVAVVEMSDSFCQPSLFYHLGVRESFSMTNNIILYCHKQDNDLRAIKVARSVRYSFSWCAENHHPFLHHDPCTRERVRALCGKWLHAQHRQYLS